ncbi:MAG: Ig-like domain-containing protein, partial [Bacteroidia bacterium]|nr:Ig-like domain-containing protein [Bacteroidia bacterium]
LITISFLIYGCASLNSLEGGEKDIDPPLLVESSIIDTNFNNKIIQLEFDEYIQLNDAEKNIKLYPEHSKVKCTVNKKKLIIKIDTSLRSNTTYYLSINNGIKDIHEGNLYSYSKLFSTGKSIDTGLITVSIDNYKNYKNYKIAILDEIPQDSLRKFNPYYTLPLNEETIKFRGLPNKIFSVWIYSDLNFDNKPDWYQSIDFEANIKCDTNIQMSLHEWNPQLNIKKVSTDGQYTKLTYSTNSNYYKIIKSNYKDQINKLIYANKDSALFEDFIYLGVIDSCKEIDVFKELHNQINNSLRIIQGKEFEVYYTKPQFYMNNFDDIRLKEEKTVYTSKKDTILIYVPRLDIMDTIDILGHIVLEESKQSLLNVKINDSLKLHYDIIIKQDGKILYTYIDKNELEIYLETGQYLIEVIESETNHEINPFIFQKPGSKKYSKALILKASWEENLQIKIE